MAEAYKRAPLEPEELEAFLNACQDLLDKAIALTLLDTGMRVSELAALKQESIKWQRGYIEIPQGKGEKRRYVPLSARVRHVLEILFAAQEDFGLSPRAIQYRVKRIAERAGIKRQVTPHVLRHTFAVLALRKGVDIRSLQQALGHSRLQTTEIYLQWSPDQMLESFQKAGWEPYQNRQL